MAVDANNRAITTKGETITWTNSNSNLGTVATVETTSKGIYAKISIAASKENLGKLTLTGVLGNSGKKVKITIEVIEKEANDKIKELKKKMEK